jgi:CRISPR type II-A-associated protein Csn2
LKLLYEPLDIMLDFDQHDIVELTLEDRDYFAKVLFELYEAFEGGESPWVLSRNDSAISLDKNAYAINDYYFMLNPSKSRTVTSALIKQITSVAEDPDHLEQSQELASKIERYALTLIDDLSYDFEVSTDEAFGVNALIKALGLKIFLNTEDLVTRTVEFLDVLQTLSGINLFILVSISQFMGTDNLKELLKEARYHGHKLLLLDSTVAGCEVPHRVLVDVNLAVL